MSSVGPSSQGEYNYIHSSAAPFTADDKTKRQMEKLIKNEDVVAGESPFELSSRTPGSFIIFVWWIVVIFLGAAIIYRVLLP